MIVGDNRTTENSIRSANDLAGKFGFQFDYSKPLVDGAKRRSHVPALLALILEALGILPYAVNFAQQFIPVSQLVPVLPGLGSHQCRLHVFGMTADSIRAHAECACHSGLRLAPKQSLVNLG